MADAMAFPFELIALLIWNCLVGTPASMKNYGFAVAFSTKAVLMQLFRATALSFADGLLDVIQCTHPPGVAYFKSTPPNKKNVWAVYVVVLEKPGCRPKIYIGSGTNATRGSTVRDDHYRKLETLPINVQRALNDGYTVQHFGLLCWTPIPTAAKQWRVRALFLALEATLSFLFGAMVSKDKDYSMGHATFWDRGQFEYDRCCSHSALYERIQGLEQDLSNEQIEEKAEALKRKRSVAKTARSMTWKKTNRAAYNANMRKTRANNKERKKYFCEPCDFAFNNRHDLDSHKTSKVHRDKVNGVTKAPDRKAIKHAQNKDSKKFYCPVCDTTFVNQQVLNTHRTRKVHLDKVAAQHDPDDSGVELDDVESSS